MGQKVNPTGFRLGISKKQNANWYAKGKDFSTYLIQDLKVREYFKTKLKNSSISKIELERSAENFVVSIYTSRPGIIIGKRGEEIDNLKKAVLKISKIEVTVNIKEIKKPELNLILSSRKYCTTIRKKNRYKSPLIIISSKELLQEQMKKLGFIFEINLINKNFNEFEKLNNKKINLIDVKI